jgi:hypothetical protein
MALTENIEAILCTTQHLKPPPKNLQVSEYDPERVEMPRPVLREDSRFTEGKELVRSYWKNNVIDKIAGVLFDLGFVESISEGRNIIIPVLSARGLLPTEESSLPAAAPREKNHREQTLDKWLTRRLRQDRESLDQVGHVERQSN